MKRVFTLMLLCFASSAFSQSSVLEPGVYKANAKGQNIMLRILEGNKYEMAIFHGRFVVENDTITFLNRESDATPFQIKAVKDAPFSSTFKIRFKTQDLLLGGTSIYIGTQEDDNAVIDYKPLSDFVNKRAFGYSGRQKDLKIDVGKVKYLYFVDTYYGRNTIISKFQIDPNENEIEVAYNGGALMGMELKGVINPETKKLLINEGKSQRDILEFDKESTTPEAKTNEIKPLTVVTEKDWAKKNGIQNEYDYDDGSYIEKRQKTKYTFKHAVIKNFNDGLKSLEKTPEKFLVMVVDDRKEAKKEFDAFIKNQEERLSRRMFKGYDAKKDNFNFYLATDKDKTTIANFKVKDKPALIFVNSNGDVIYHTIGTLEEKEELFDSYYSVYGGLQRANEHYKLDKLINNKKASIADFKKAFIGITKTVNGYDYNYEDDMAVDTVAVEMPPMAVDTAAAVYPGQYDDYYHVEDPENLYSIKASKETIVAKWRAIVDFYAKNNTYDEEFISMCKAELLNTGFISKLYGEQTLVSETDFKVLDYLYKNYDQIKNNEEKERKSNAQLNEYGDEYENQGYAYLNSYNNITNVLSAFFGKRTSESSHLHRSSQVKLIEYYKTFLQLSGYRLEDVSTYLARIKETNTNDYSLYFKEYGEYFDKINSKGSSIIESLDQMYIAQKSGFIEWKDFKYNFAMLANNVAWAVVETKNNDANTIQAAVKWSEMSLKIVKNDFHCLDTLAQLYYKNNEKEKAITTEKLAIDNLNPKDATRIEEYGEILERMKNGTY